jgi:hypothetical protein
MNTYHDPMTQPRKQAETQEQKTLRLAREVVDGKPLSHVREQYGETVAAQVHNETVTRSWQVVKWTRRVR